MPVISEFYGIKIFMFWKVLVDIVNGTVIKGVFPFKQLKLVLAWCEIHREELLRNWENAKQQLEINKIKPLV